MALIEEEIDFSKPINELGSKTQRAIKRALKREATKLTGKEQEELKNLQRKALSLWKEVVKLRAGKRCEVPGCKKVKRLQAHHIESYATNKMLRFDPENGVCFCTTHHKFGRESAHHSFCFMYEFMKGSRIESLEYLLAHFRNKRDLNKEDLETQIMYLETERNQIQKACYIKKVRKRV